MRARSSFLAAVLCVAAFGCAASPAAADNQVIQVRDNNYTYPGVAVKPGESVTWTFPVGGGSDHHNVHFEDGSFVDPPVPSFAPWSTSRTFMAEGVYQFYCDEHGGPGQVGMFGRVYVNATGTVPTGVPAASFTVTPGTVGTNANIALNASASSDPGGTIVRYEWDLDEDGFFERDTGAQPITSHTYPTPGEKHIRLRVTDNEANISEVEDHVHVTARPTAAFTASPSPAPTGQAVTFDASGSSDSDGSILNYRWDLDGDGTFETNTGPNATASRTYATPGTFAVSLRVTDNQGVESGVATQALQVITPVVLPPPPPIVAPPAPALAPPPAPAAQTPRLGSSIAYTARVRKTYTLLSALSIRRAKSGSTVRLSCTGKRCPFKTKTRKVTKSASKLDITSLVRGKRLRAGAKLEIRVTKSGTIGVVRRLTIRASRRPKSENLCIRPGATKPGSCSS